MKNEIHNLFYFSSIYKFIIKNIISFNIYIYLIKIIFLNWCICYIIVHLINFFINIKVLHKYIIMFFLYVLLETYYKQVAIFSSLYIALNKIRKIDIKLLK